MQQLSSSVQEGTKSSTSVGVCSMKGGMLDLSFSSLEETLGSYILYGIKYWRKVYRITSYLCNPGMCVLAKNGNLSCVGLHGVWLSLQ